LEKEMKRKNLEVIANEVTKNVLGILDNYPSKNEWYKFRDGVMAGILEGRNLHSEVMNKAISICNKSQNSTSLKKAINDLRSLEGLDKEF
jgi:hypothetical protein